MYRHGPDRSENRTSPYVVMSRRPSVGKTSARDQLRFAEYLGPVARRKLPDDYKIPPSSREEPGIAYVSNVRDTGGEPDGIIPDGEMWFHHDTCYKPAPDRFTMLYGIRVPRIGGNNALLHSRHYG